MTTGLRLDVLASALHDFAESRGWLHFHTPSNLSRALLAEAAELDREFLWGREPPRERIAEELADVVIFAVNCATAAGVDLSEAIRAKLRENERRPFNDDGTLGR